MADVRIVVRNRNDGFREVSVVDVYNSREIRAGTKVNPGDLEAAVRNLKTSLERGGHRVDSVKHL